jgi:pSer/pThr/pTyr-binding forkhead associated (FHA) protein
MRVELTNTDDPTHKIVLNTLPAMLGQDEYAEVRLKDSWVGRYQCIIDQEGDRLMVLDLGSKTGTYIDGMRVRKAHLLPGDTLTVGRTNFLVEYQCGGDEPLAVEAVCDKLPRK